LAARKSDQQKRSSSPYATIGDHLKPITQIANKILAAFRKQDQRALRKLNDEVLKIAGLDCDKVCFDLAVYSYVLSKVVSKPRYLGKDYVASLKNIAFIFQSIVEKMEFSDRDDLLRLFSELDKSLARLEEKDPRFIVDLVTKGRLKMAATFYAQGVSLGVAAEMTGLDKQEILDYAGETMMFDRLKDEMTIEDRLKIARKLLTG
jgi:hypothetical protein